MYRESDYLRSMQVVSPVAGPQAQRCDRQYPVESRADSRLAAAAAVVVSLVTGSHYHSDRGLRGPMVVCGASNQVELSVLKYMPDHSRIYVLLILLFRDLVQNTRE